LEKLKHDAEIATTEYFAAIMKTIVMPPFEALLIPAGKVVIDPLASAVPDSLKDFLDIKQMFEDLYNGVIDDSIDVVLGSDKVPQKEKKKKIEDASEPNGAEITA